MDGLERLIVVCCGLDARIDDGHASASVVARRSLLYRAVTRAHLVVVVVVNECVEGGWLEFLQSVRLRAEEAFDASTELARSSAHAADRAVEAEVVFAEADFGRRRVAPV